MSIQHANRGIVKKNLQLYYNREFSKSFPGEATSDISKPISISPQGGSLTVATTYPAFSEDMTVGNYFKNASNGGVLYHLVTNPALSNNAIYNNNGGIASTTVVPISGTYLIFSFYVYLTQLYTGYNGALGGYINVNTNGGGNGSVGSVLTSYGWSFYVNGVLDNAWSNNSAYLNKWVRVVAIVNNGAISASAKYFSSWYIYNDRLTGGSMYIAKFQIEQKQYVTRPVIYDILTNTSNRGETTTNLISNPDFTSTSNWNNNGNVTISTITVGAKSYLKVVSNQGSSTPGILSDAIAVTAGTVYTLSAYAYRSGTEAYLYVYNVTANSDLIWISQNAAALGGTEGWCVNKFTVPAGCTSIKVGILWGSASIGDTFYVEKMQLEQREYQSAFVVGSRTANTTTGNGGLLDLSVNRNSANLNSSAIAYDSSGFYFNADYAGAITIPVTSSVLDTLSNVTHTYEVWFKLLGTPPGISDGYFFGRQGYHEGFAHFKSTPATFGCLTWYNDNNNTGWLSYAGSLNTWYHSAYVVDVEAGFRYFYVNGVLNSSGSLTKQLKQYVSGPSNYYHFGSANPDYSSNIALSSAKAYNRALTADEIMQNFTATRKTYGI